MKERLANLRKSLTDDIPAVVVSGSANVRYLIGAPTLFDEDFSALLLVTRKTAHLIVDPRYIDQVKAAGLPGKVAQWSGSSIRTLAGLVKRARVRRLGFEPRHLSVSRWQLFKKELNCELMPADALVEAGRAIKDEAEIASLARAAEITDQTFSEILPLIKVGVAEREIAMEIDFRLRRLGADDRGFSTIVAGGPNSAFPHAGAGERRLTDGDFVKLDFGAVYGGYRADMTRTVVLGRPSGEQKDLYRHVALAQEEALEGLAPGVTGKEIDELARGYFRSIGMAEKFGHNLGHGVGLDIHEAPTLGVKSDNVLEVAMVFTIEPGLYLPGFGGVRIEDTVVLREHGIQILTGSSKELLEL